MDTIIAQGKEAKLNFIPRLLRVEIQAIEFNIPRVTVKLFKGEIKALFEKIKKRQKTKIGELEIDPVTYADKNLCLVTFRKNGLVTSWPFSVPILTAALVPYMR